ncbi:protein O-GlcNAc transferase [uncultured Gammaproteobacteria bacterium]
MTTVGEILATAVRHHQAGTLDAAAALYRQILAVVPDQPDSLRLLAVIALQRGELTTARDLLKRALAAQPQFCEALSNLGNVYKALNQPTEAEAAYRQALTVRADYADAWFNLGNLYRDTRRPQQAIEAYRQAVMTRPGYAEAENNLGSIHYDQGAHDQAVAAFERALAVNPNFAQAWNNLGNARKALDQPDLARAAYLRALALNDGFVPVLVNLGALCDRLDHLEEAIGFYRRALTVDPNHLPALANLGAALTTLDRLEEAAETYAQAILTGEATAEIYAGLARVRERQQRWDQAEQALRLALTLTPDDPDLLTDLARAQFERGGPGGEAEAALLCQRAAEIRGQSPHRARAVRVVTAREACAARGWDYHPAFATRPMTLAIDSALWNRADYQLPEAWLARVENAVVLPGNFTVLLDDRELIIDGLHPYSRVSLGMVEGFRFLSQDQRVLIETGEPAREFDEELILFGGDRNFSHGVLDWASKLTVLERFPEVAAGRRLLVAGSMLPVIGDLLTLLGYPPERRVTVGAGEVVRCRSLWLPSLTHNYQYLSPDHALALRARVMPPSFNQGGQGASRLLVGPGQSPICARIKA